MEKVANEVQGLLLAVYGEPADSSPIDIKTKHQVIYLNEVTNRAILRAIRNEKSLFKLLVVIKKFNEEIENILPEEIKEIKSLVMLEEEKENPLQQNEEIKEEKGE